MLVPVVKHGDVLIAQVQSSLTDRELLSLRDELSAQVGHHRSRGVILDVTAMEVMDSFATRMVRGIAHALKLRGAKTVVVGIQPDVAFSMVQLGLVLDDVATALDLEDGLELLAVLRRKAGVDESLV